MFRKLTRAALLGCVVLSASSITVGCSSTNTHRSTGETVDDGTITAKVKAALIQDPTTKAREINVDTYRGVVQLSGFVDDRDARSRAVEVARKVGGVKEVRDNLEVKPATPAS